MKFWKKAFIIIGVAYLTVSVIRFVYFLWGIGFFVTDTSAVYDGGTLYWNEKTYSITHGDYTTGKPIAKCKEGRDWKIQEIEEDPSHTFVAMFSFLDNYLLVDNTYEIPKSGRVTVASWSGEYIHDPDFLKAVEEIESKKTTSFTHFTDGIYSLTENQRMRPLYIGFEDCPVATENCGYMGKIDGNWVITTYISDDTRAESGAPKIHDVGCYTIPEEYHGILEKHFFE